jgi:hypothetical protein
MATTIQQPIFVCLNKANLGWVARREGKPLEAEEYGKAALAEWQLLPTANYTYYSQWTALFPLIDIALTQDQISESVDYARKLLVPEQQVLPDELTKTVEEAIQAWDSNNKEAVRALLQQTIKVAQKRGYL